MYEVLEKPLVTASRKFHVTTKDGNQIGWYYEDKSGGNDSTNPKSSSSLILETEINWRVAFGRVGWVG